MQESSASLRVRSPNSPIAWRRGEVLAAIGSWGWCWTRGLSIKQLASVCSDLGNIVDTTSVRRDPNARSYLCDWRPVPLHTDHPAVDILAWYCHEQDADDGANVLLYSHDVLARLPPAAREELRSTLVPFPALDAGSNAGLTHVLSADEALFFAPWLEPFRTTPSDAYGDLRRLVQSQAVATRIRLLPGDVLLVDNKRVLHGRDAIRRTSKRRLTRFWVRKRVR